MSSLAVIGSSTKGLLNPDNLTAYLAQIRQIPVISVEEERRLFTKLKESNDTESARKLVVSNLRFVAHIAKGYQGYGLSQLDLIQEGSIGLMKAIQKFDANVGVRLITFAVHWIKSEIHEFILRNWKIVKVATTKDQRKVFFNLRKKVQNIYSMTRQEAIDVSTSLNVSLKEVYGMQKKMMAHFFRSMDEPISLPGEEAASLFLSDTMEDQDMSPCEKALAQDWQQKSSDVIRQAIAQLDERSMQIIQRRWLHESDKPTLAQLGREMGVSTERVRQLEQRALAKIKSLLDVLEG